MKFNAESMAEIFRVFGDPTRLKMIRLLAFNGEFCKEKKLCVADLAKMLGIQMGGVPLEKRAALLAEAAEVVGVKILGRRARELRLTFDLLAGQHEIGQRSIGLDALKGAIEGGARNAHALGLGPQLGQEAAIARVGGLGQDRPAGHRTGKPGERHDGRQDAPKRTPAPSGARMRRPRPSPGRMRWAQSTIAMTAAPKIAGTTVMANDPPPGSSPIARPVPPRISAAM